MGQLVFGLIGFFLLLPILLLLPIGFSVKNKSILIFTALCISLVVIFSLQVLSVVTSWVILVLLIAIASLLVLKRLSFSAESTDEAFFEAKLEMVSNKSLVISDSTFNEVKPEQIKEVISLTPPEQLQLTELDETDFLNSRIIDEKVETRLIEDNFIPELSFSKEDDIEINFDAILSDSNSNKERRS
ncbi:hypothetical protein ACFFIX_01700 [Metabacillus herbersteinensis]|uniref:Uncharacterized protein n=1 Tax=Metabacillus herbersteinensis TaxID=283816 RepID=A0ABV6GAD9_9BACI